MTEAHISTVLPIKNRVLAADEHTTFLAHYDLNEHDVLRGVKAMGSTSALNFDGVDDYVDFDNPGLSTLTNCTVEFWCKTSSNASWLFLKGQTNGQYVMATSAGAGNFYHSAAGTITTYVDGVAATKLVRDGQWHHYAAVGVSLSSWTALQMSNYSSFHIHGSIQNIRIWNRALTIEEIQRNMNSEVKNDESGLRAYWKLQEGEGNVVQDFSPFHNDARIIGATWGVGNSIFTMRPQEGRFGGAIAIEAATTNLGTTGMSGMGSGLTYTYVGVEDGYKKYSVDGTWSGGTYPYSFNLGGTAYTAGISCSASCYIYTNVPEKYQANFGNLVIVNDGAMTGVNRANRIGNYSTREDYIHSVNFPSNAVYVYSCPIANGTVFNPATDFVYLKNVQVEQKAFATSFVDGTRPAPKLAYPVGNVLNKDEFTVSAWINLNVVSGISYVMSVNDGNLNRFNMFMNGNKAMFEYYNGTSYSVISSNITAVRSWSYIVFRYSRSAGTLAVFLNGVQTSSSIVLPTIPDFKNLFVGVDFNGVSNMLNGMIDELRIDKVARSDDEIAAWYESNSPFWPRGIYRKSY